MKRLLDEYEKTIGEISEHIKALRAELKSERNIKKVHELERRIDVLMVERRELVGVVAELKRHLGPKMPSPSLLKQCKAV